MRKIFLIFLPIFYFAVSNYAEAYSTKTHAFLTKAIIDFYQSNFPQEKISDKYINYIIEGSIREDDPPRWMNHFYDPVYKRGLSYDPKIEFVNFGNWPSSKEWVRNEIAQNYPLYKTKAFFSSILSVFQKSKIEDISLDTNFTYEKALDFYRRGEEEKAMFALGHILHLLEDLGVPDHTRNDQHADGSPYENWAEKFNLENEDQSLKKNLKSEKPVILSSIDDYFDKLALYSNNNFFSKDTIGIQSGYVLPEINYENTFLDNGNNYFYKKNNEGQNYFLLRYRKNGSFLGIKDFDFTINDEKILSSYWKELSPKIVAYGAGFINLFLKEGKKLKTQFNLSESASVLSALRGNEEEKNEKMNSDFEMESVSYPKPLVYIEKFVVQSGEEIILKGKNFTPLQKVRIFIEKSSDDKDKRNFDVDANAKGEIESKYSIPEEAEGVYAYFAKDLKNEILSEKFIYTVLKSVKKISADTLKNEEEKNVLQKNSYASNNNLKNEPAPKKVSCSFDENKTPNRNSIIFNEIAWMGGSETSGLDASNEWLELKNLNAYAIDISGYQIISRRGKINIIFPEGSKVNPWGYYLLERTDDNSVPNIPADMIYKGGISNSDDGLELFDERCDLLDKVIADPEWPAGNSAMRRSMERKADFSWYTSGSFNGKIYGTPKSPNGPPYESSFYTSNNFAGNSNQLSNSSVQTSSPNQTETSTLLKNIIISEIMYDYPGSDEGHEWIEIKNLSNYEIDISSLSIFENKTAHAIKSSNGNFILSGGEIAVIANNTSTFMLDFPQFSGKLFYASFSLSNSGEEIALRYKDDVFNKIVYTSSLGAAGDSNSLQLINNNLVWSSPTPGLENIFNQSNRKANFNESEKVIVGAKAENLVISEVRVEGKDAGDEFIEIYNPTDKEIDLSGWSLQYISGGSKEFSSGTLYKKNFPPGSIIRPFKFFLAARGLDENGSDGYAGKTIPDMTYRSFGLSSRSDGGAIFLVSTTTFISSLYDEKIISSVFYGDGEIFKGFKTAPVPSSGASLQRKAFLNGYCVSSLPLSGENQFLGKNCVTLLGSGTDFELRADPFPQNSQSLKEPRNAPTVLSNFPGEEKIAFYNYSDANILFKWKSSLDDEGSPSGIIYQLSIKDDSNGETIVGTTTFLSFVYPISKLDKDYHFILTAYDRDGKKSSPLDVFVKTPVSEKEDSPMIFKNTVIQAKSLRSHYSDNWYNLGRGFSGNLKSITLRGFIDDNQFYNSEIYLKEFEDENYTREINSFTLSLNAPFTNIVSNVKIDGLDIKLNPFSFYRLVTKQNYQGRSVILLGDDSFGKAMRNDYIFGVGRVEDYYTFYPFILMEGNGLMVDVSSPQKPTKPVIKNIFFDKFELFLSVSWERSSDLDSLDEEIKYEINYTPFSDLNKNEWIDLGNETSYKIPVLFPNKYKIAIRARDELGLFSETEEFEWRFPENFMPYVLSRSYNTASQEFVPNKNFKIRSLSLFTKDFSTQSLNRNTNSCFLKIEGLSGEYLAVEADNSFEGDNCAGKISFNFSSDPPQIFGGRRYRFFYYINHPSGGVKFYGINEDKVGGIFSGYDFKNAYFEIETMNGEIISNENWKN